VNQKPLILSLYSFILATTLACSFLPNVTPSSAGKTVTVCAKQGWTNTGIHVTSGNLLKITYLGGKWSPWKGELFDAFGSGGDPRCRCNVIKGVSHAALIGKIGDYNPFLVGEQYLHKVGESGELFLGINDVDIHDNSGCLNVEIEIE